MISNLGLSSDLYLCLNVHTFQECQQAFDPRRLDGCLSLHESEGFLCEGIISELLIYVEKCAERGLGA